MRKVRAYIRLQALQNNADAFLRLTNTRLCAVVKANAYGHGAEEVVCALCDRVDCFAVSLLDEAKAIRVAACGKDILILTPPTDMQDIYSAAVNGFILTVSNIETGRQVREVARKHGLFIRVHLKVNTGMNRYGVEYTHHIHSKRFAKRCAVGCADMRYGVGIIFPTSFHRL